MSRWRIILLVICYLTPVVFLLALGGYTLFVEKPWGYTVSWLLVVSWALGTILAWHWQRKRQLIHEPDFAAPLHWTELDRKAWQLVVARAQAAHKLPSAQFAQIPFYVDTAQEMARELARAYDPYNADPFDRLTVPEMLAVVELASHDLAELVEQYVPGGHLLTVAHWRKARQAADWYNRASNVYWALSALFSPLKTAARFTASRLGVSFPWQALQENLLLWFYVAYVHRLGTYLIELNSGRLRVGATRYRQLLNNVAPDVDAPVSPGVTVAVLGQVKSGKSSLINAFLGEQKARADVLPATSEITRYDLHRDATTLSLLDTVGYGHDGAGADQVAATAQAVQASDLVLLVLHARNPARQADVSFLQALIEWFAARPHLRKPPILAVLTHIDLLSPALEWAPPYDWKKPHRPKEEQIKQALLAVRDQLGANLSTYVPVCSAEGKVYGIEEWLLPAIIELLDEAHAVALLRCLKAEADAAKVRRVFQQLLAAGKGLAGALWNSPRP